MSRTTTSPPGLDPSAPGTIIRGALAAESVLTVGLGAYIMFMPRHYLHVALGAATPQITQTAIQMTQQYGFTSVFFGAIEGLFVSNSRLSIETRPILYRTLLAFELGMVGLCTLQGQTTEDGMAKSALMSNAAVFAAFAAWRVFTLWVKPEWFGRVLEGKKAE
ncbi:hypothetical protein NX059_003661 [Plenodomus lindquistii]|nr:hypothetical protein NX059_003661 [Plenodomus lindquistii]